MERLRQLASDVKEVCDQLRDAGLLGKVCTGLAALCLLSFLLGVVSC